jgi:hypothetical protein
LWHPGPNDVRGFIQRFRRTLEKDGPVVVRDAMQRVQQSIDEDVKPDLEDTVIVMLYLMDLEDQRQQRKERRKVPRNQLGWAGVRKKQRRSVRHRQPEQKEQHLPETGFAEQMRKQMSEDDLDNARATRVRVKFGVPRSRARKGKNGTVIVRGDDNH